MSQYKGRILVCTESKYFLQKIRLDLLCEYECIPCGRDIDTSESFTDVIWDSELGAPPEGYSVIIPGRDIPLHLPLGGLSSLLSRRSSALSLVPSRREAIVMGRAVKLTELEFSLLSYLYEKNGDYASREELLRSVWSDDAESGIINVYIHYLREKLESSGERIILSSRKSGYAINERYLEGGKKCYE